MPLYFAPLRRQGPVEAARQGDWRRELATLASLLPCLMLKTFMWGVVCLVTSCVSGFLPCMCEARADHCNMAHGHEAEATKRPRQKHSTMKSSVLSKQHVRMSPAKLTKSLHECYKLRHQLKSPSTLSSRLFNFNLSLGATRRLDPFCVLFVFCGLWTRV